MGLAEDPYAAKVNILLEKEEYEQMLQGRVWATGQGSIHHKPLDTDDQDAAATFTRALGESLFNWANSTYEPENGGTPTI